MATDDTKAPEWTVLYHGIQNGRGQFKGRGEFLRLMLEDKGVAYLNSSENLYGSTGLMDGFRGSPEAVKAQAPGASFPLLYPPALLHQPTDGSEPVLINQTAACMIYLGDMLGYAPSSHAERARANAVLCNAMDFIAEGRLSFHPVNGKASYTDQKAEGDKASKEFSQNRLKTYLYHFHKAVAIKGGKNPVAGGTEITYADFALFHVLDATVAQFNTEFYDHAWDRLDVPALKEYYSWMKGRPNLQLYFQSDRCARTLCSPCCFEWLSWSI